MIDFNNPYQGNYKRLLFVCSGGMLRSATFAHILAGRGFNTRCAGIDPRAIQPVHDNTLQWAEHIYCMEQGHKTAIQKHYMVNDDKITVLNIPDIFAYRDPKLIEKINEIFPE